ncbi:unnamed protein product, partial [marine sediment metagenome]
FDLTNKQFRVGDATSYFDWNVTTADTLTIKGALVQSPAGSTFPIGSYRGAYGAGTTYYKGDQVTYSGSTWLYINVTAGAGHTPANNTYWDIVANEGDQGIQGIQGATGADGSDGTDARAVNLTSVVQGFDYDTNGENPSPSTTEITAVALNTTGTVYYDFYVNDVSQQNTTSNTYTYTPQADYDDMPDKIEVNIREGSGGSAVLASDQMTIVGLKAGVDAITIVLSNEAHTLPTTNLGVVTYTGSGTTIKVWEGTNPLNVDQNTA